MNSFQSPCQGEINNHVITVIMEFVYSTRMHQDGVCFIVNALFF